MNPEREKYLRKRASLLDGSEVTYTFQVYMQELFGEIDELREANSFNNKEANHLRSTLSEAIGLGNGADWDAIREHATELAALYQRTYGGRTEGLTEKRENYLREKASTMLNGADVKGYPLRVNMQELFSEIDRLRGVQETRQEAAQRNGDKLIELEKRYSDRGREIHRRGRSITDLSAEIHQLEKKLTSANEEIERLRAVNANRHAGHCDGNCGMSIAECAVASQHGSGDPSAQSGVATPGCNCGHDGMGIRWHMRACVWRADASRRSAKPDQSANSGNVIMPEFVAARDAIEQAWPYLRAALDALARGEHVEPEAPSSEPEPDTLPQWLRDRYGEDVGPWEYLTDDTRSYWRHEADAVRRAVERGGFRDPHLKNIS